MKIINEYIRDEELKNLFKKVFDSVYDVFVVNDNVTVYEKGVFGRTFAVVHNNRDQLIVYCIPKIFDEVLKILHTIEEKHSGHPIELFVVGEKKIQLIV